MIELYGSGSSRSAKCYWMLKELNLDFKEHTLNLLAGEQKTPTMLALNPFGKAPMLKDDDFVLFEAMAIINYLGEKFPQSKLVPTSGTHDRALYDQWISFSITDLEQPLWRIFKHRRLLPEKLRIAQDIELAKEDFARIASVLNKQIGAKKYIVADRFTAADITLAYTLGWAKTLGLLEAYPNCLRYYLELAARPAFPAHLFKR